MLFASLFVILDVIDQYPSSANLLGIANANTVLLFYSSCRKGRMFGSFSFSSVAQSSPTLCDPMNRSTPGLPVHHQLPEFTQTHVH